MDKLSVIIPVFNGADTIVGAVNSVLGQDYPEVELIVVDGGSSDGTLGLLETLLAKQDFYLIQGPDKGIYDAMNKGIRASTGDWLYFMGSDDEFYSREVVREIFRDELVGTADLVYGKIIYRESGRVIGESFSSLTILKKNIPHQAMFYRKELFTRLGLYDLDFRIAADYVFNLKVFGDGTIRKLYIDKIVARFNEAGLSGTARGDQLFEEKKPAIVRKEFSIWLYLYTVLVLPIIHVVSKRLLKQEY